MEFFCRRTLSLYITLLFSLIWQSQSAVRHKYNVLVSTAYGQVEGITIPTQYTDYPHRRVNMFLGVPYAKRPAQFRDWRREFRFKKPEPPYWSGILDATAYQPACPQHLWLIRETLPKYSKTSEDCLYLNVFAPNYTEEISTPNPPLYPVMVFFHGGGWTMGTPEQYPAMFLAERQIVVVTVSYRLNALGFLSTGDAYSPGNYGLWDQLLALQFVREAIKGFRGDPNKVTIAGQSTGAASVGLHILSPRVDERLFTQAIMLSGTDRSQWATIPTAEDAKYYARSLGEQVGCPMNDMARLVECLQLYRSADEIVNASAKVRLKDGHVGSPWAPVADGHFVGMSLAFLPEPPLIMRQQGQFKYKVRVLAGLVKDEAAFFIPNLPSLDQGIDEIQFANIIREFLNDRNVKNYVATNEALEFQYTYWPQYRNQSMIRQMLIDMMSDYMFGSTTNEVLNHHALKNITFQYLFDYKSWADYLPPWRGVANGQDLQYIFGLPFWNETYTQLTGFYPRQEYDYPDRNMSEYMITLITNFTANNHPTPFIFPVENYKNVTWIQYNLVNHTYLSIQNTSENRQNFRQSSFAFWERYFPRISAREPHCEKEAVEVDDNSKYQTSTWALTAASAILLILLLVVSIMICLQSRQKKY